MIPPEPPNWWAIIHKFMQEVPWGSPDRFLAMTIPQLHALSHERPPGGPKPLESAEDVAEMLEQRAKREQQWSDEAS